MFEYNKDNAIRNRDYAILVPVLVPMCYLLVKLASSIGNLAVLGGCVIAMAVSLCPLSLAVLYHPAARYAMPAFFLVSLACTAVGFVEGTQTIMWDAPFFVAPIAILSCVVLARHSARVNHAEEAESTEERAGSGHGV